MYKANTCSKLTCSKLITKTVIAGKGCVECVEIFNTGGEI